MLSSAQRRVLAAAVVKRWLDTPMFVQPLRSVCSASENLTIATAELRNDSAPSPIGPQEVKALLQATSNVDLLAKAVSSIHAVLFRVSARTRAASNVLVVEDVPRLYSSLCDAMLAAGQAGDSKTCAQIAEIMRVYRRKPTTVAGNAWIWSVLGGPRLLRHTGDVEKEEYGEHGSAPGWEANIDKDNARAGLSLLKELVSGGFRMDEDTVWLGIAACSRVEITQVHSRPSHQLTGDDPRGELPAAITGLDAGQGDWQSAQTMWTSYLGSVDSGSQPPVLAAWSLYMQLASRHGHRNECEGALRGAHRAMRWGRLYAVDNPLFLSIVPGQQRPPVVLHPVSTLPLSLLHTALYACLWAGQPWHAFTLCDTARQQYGVQVDGSTHSVLLSVAANGPENRVQDLLDECMHMLSRDGWDTSPLSSTAGTAAQVSAQGGSSKPLWPEHVALAVHAFARGGEFARAYDLLQVYRQMLLTQSHSGPRKAMEAASSSAPDFLYPYASVATYLLRASVESDSPVVPLSQACSVLTELVTQARHDGLLQIKGIGHQEYVAGPSLALLQATITALSACGRLDAAMEYATDGSSFVLQHPALLVPIVRLSGCFQKRDKAAAILRDHIVGKQSPVGHKQAVYGALVQACVDEGDVAAGLQVLDVMQSDKVAPTEASCFSLYAEALAQRDWELVDAVHLRMTDSGMQTNSAEFVQLQSGAMRVFRRVQEGRDFSADAAGEQDNQVNEGELLGLLQQESASPVSIDDYLPSGLRRLSSRTRTSVLSRGGWAGLGRSKRSESGSKSSKLSKRQQLESGVSDEDDFETVQLAKVVANGRPAIAATPTVSHNHSSVRAAESQDVEPDVTDGHRRAFDELRLLLADGAGANAGGRGEQHVRLRGPNGRVLVADSLGHALSTVQQQPIAPASTSGSQSTGSGPVPSAWDALLRTFPPAPTADMQMECALFLRSQGLKLCPAVRQRIRNWEASRTDLLGLVLREDDMDDDGVPSAVRDRAARKIQGRIYGIDGFEGVDDDEEGLVDLEAMDDEDVNGLEGDEGEVVYDGNKPFMPHLTADMPSEEDIPVVMPAQPADTYSAGRPRQRLMPGMMSSQPSQAPHSTHESAAKAYAKAASARYSASVGEAAAVDPTRGGPAAASDGTRSQRSQAGRHKTK